jgi:hypothetical protein
LTLPRAATVAVLAVAAVSVATGIRQLDDGELVLRDYSLRTKAILAGIERAEGSVPEDYSPLDDPALEGLVPSQLPLEAGPYLEAVDRFGSFAFSEDELAEEDPALQDLANRVARSASAAGTE